MPTPAFALLSLLSYGVAAYGLVMYGAGEPGSNLHPDMRTSFAEHAVGIRIHVFASALALLLGPTQFVAAIRAALPRLHRWMGRLYLGVAVLAGGTAGLYMAVFATGGLAAKLGFGLLAALWLYTGVRAWAAIRRGDIAAHRRWMVRNFALALAAVTLRLYLPTALAAGASFDIAYPLIAWACWLPNLALAEWLLRRRPA